MNLEVNLEVTDEVIDGLTLARLQRDVINTLSLRDCEISDLVYSRELLGALLNVIAYYTDSREYTRFTREIAGDLNSWEENYYERLADKLADNLGDNHDDDH